MQPRGPKNVSLEQCDLGKGPGKVEGAYRRGDLFEKRQRLMADWARYCESTPVADSNVVSLRGRE